MFPVKTSTVDGHSHLFRGWGRLIQESRFQDWGGQLDPPQSPLKIYFGAADQGRHWEHRDCIFCGAKNIINGAAGEKF